MKRRTFAGIAVLGVIGAVSLACLSGCDSRTQGDAASAQAPAASEAAPASSDQQAPKTDVSGADAIDSQNALNHRTCIAGGGVWDTSVSTPTTVPDHPFIGECRGSRPGPVCSERDEKCWKFVQGNRHAKANPKWNACRGDDPDPLCGSAED